MEIGYVNDETAAFVVDESFDFVHVYALSDLIQQKIKIVENEEIKKKMIVREKLLV